MHRTRDGVWLSEGSALEGLEIDGYPWLIAHDPSLVPGPNVEDIPLAQLHVFAAARGPHAQPTLDRDADVVDLTALTTCHGLHVRFPTPARPVRGSAHSLAAELHDLVPAARYHQDLVTVAESALFDRCHPLSLGGSGVSIGRTMSRE